MSEMSPLATVLMTILRKGVWIAGGLLVLFISIALWQTRQPDGTFNVTAQDLKFIGVMVAVLLLAVYLIRAFAKEMNNPGS
jgi:hypothetical protein